MLSQSQGDGSQSTANQLSELLSKLGSLSQSGDQQNSVAEFLSRMDKLQEALRAKEQEVC